jgi:hypothetical protein
MPYQRSQFCGASVRGWSSSIGWNVGQQSQMTVQLVVDPVNGDVFNPPGVGTPVYFKFYAFQFNGLLQKWQETRGSEGNPTFEVTVVDPREILDAAQVIIGGYAGSVGTVRNLQNVYGFWENTGFGNSLANETGMPWFKILAGVEILCNTPVYGAFGGPLTYRGVAYGIDLSQLPVPPAHYRLGGTSFNLLDMIAQVCEDGACDFFVELKGRTIVVRTVARFAQPPLGTITAVANANFGGTLVRSQAGLESRNEITSAFLVGGDVTTLYLTDAIASFWGFGIDGLPVVGTPGFFTATVDDPQGGPPSKQKIPTQFMGLNAAPVADIIGGLVYATSTLELRMVLEGQNLWKAFLQRYKPALAKLLGIAGPLLNKGALNILKPDLVNDAKAAAKQRALLALLTDAEVKVQRLFAYLHGYAEEYLGRKYLVGLPFILDKIDPETLKITASYDVTDAGYLPEGSAPLGLSPLNEDVFKSQDGRFRCFVEYPSVLGANLSKVSPQGSVLENGSLFVSAQADPNIVYLDTPYAVVTVPGPVQEQATDFLGNADQVAKLLGIQANQQKQVQQKPQFGTAPVRLSAEARAPSVVAIPLKSNLLTYGPWYRAGAPGKVRFEVDPTLTPWNYGGFAVMNLAGFSKVLTAVSNMQVSETGSIEVSEPPAAPLGSVLQAGGPNVTSVDVTFGTQGVTTTYRFATFTQRFGVFNKQTAERLKRLGLAAADLRRSVRVALRQQEAVSEAADKAVLTARAARKFLADADPVIKRETPHDVLVGTTFFDELTGDVRVGVSSATAEEAVAFTYDDDDAIYQSNAAMSLNGLLRPFATGSGTYLSSYTEIDSGLAGMNILTVDSLDPWKDQNDIEFYAWGSSYDGLHAYRREGDNANARPLALRGPLVLSGWGWDTAGVKVPANLAGDDWVENYLKRSDLWKTGPLDPLWDEARGVWSVHDAVRGVLTSDLPAGSGEVFGEGTMEVRLAGGVTTDLTVFNYFSADVADGTKVIANYVAGDNKWFVVAADCLPG